MKDSARDLRKWLDERGGDCAIAVTKKGGRQMLAQGEIAPHTFGTAKLLIDAGIAEYYFTASGAKRLRLLASPVR